MSASPTWDPAVYARFGDERSRPFVDLTARIGARSPRHVVDLGCGPGTLTASLADRWPHAVVEGIDSSPAMVESAAQLSGTRARLRIHQGDIRAWVPDDDVDVVVSNAALQWVPGHDQLLRRWLGQLSPGCWLAVQVPGNFGSPSHTLLRDLANSARWHRRLDGVLRHADAVGSPESYLDLLLGSGWQAEAWETTYLHVLEGSDPVLGWVRGTALRPVLDALSEEEGAEFEAQYRLLLREAYPVGEHGTPFPFRRIFFVGRKPDAGA
ncbi:MAG TPA: trans-aconitate 2-methyltransferase [Propionibacteriaceae bacterium]|nr:trans-aconitate 2-methyltransferase [Propionibacteriaceae bacterium]